jgi:hypothetical protein
MATLTIKKATVEEVYREAYAAGLKAGHEVQVTPMVVGTETSPFSNVIDETKQTYFVEGGVCGFAWVKIRPARGKFVQFLKDKEIGSKDNYEGGYTIWCHEFGQSLTRKEAFVGAFAEVLRNYGIDAYGQSRID